MVKIENRLEEFEIQRKGRFLQDVLKDRFETSIDDIITKHEVIDLTIPEKKAQKLASLSKEELLQYYIDIAIEEIDVKEGTERIIEEIKPYAERIKPLVRNTKSELHRLIREGKKISIEGAQGTSLSIEHGTYPYVTSSDCILAGTLSGVGVSYVDLMLGIVKFPFMTRVGGGAFPTELGGGKSEKYCAKDLECDIFYEAKTYLGIDIDLASVRKWQAEQNYDALNQHEKIVKEHIKAHREAVVRLINSKDPFEKGVGMRLAAFEYGATTKRPRRTGWTDAVAARYAVGLNGVNMILTKVDCLAGANEFNLCFGHEVDGRTYSEFNRDNDFLRNVKPVLQPFAGYGDIRDVRDFDRLPSSLLESMKKFEEFTYGRVVAVSNGPEREQMIIR